jgi:hypothetical protein
MAAKDAMNRRRLGKVPRTMDPRDFGRFIRTVNTYLLDEVLPYYIGPGDKYLVTANARSQFLTRILFLPPVKAAIKGIRRHLSKNRFYYGPEPDREIIGDPVKTYPCGIHPDASAHASCGGPDAGPAGGRDCRQRAGERDGKEERA